MIRTVKKPMERRADIIRAARDLFQTKEYDKTTMQDVVQALGIAKGTIYHYFSSKEALLEAVVEDIVDNAVELMRTRLQETIGDSLKKMQVLIKTGNIAASHPTILKGLHTSGNEALHTRVLAVMVLRQAPLYAQVIKQGCDENVFKTDNPLECAEFILAATQFITDRGIYHWDQKDLQRRARALPKLIEQQLQAPAESLNFLIPLLEPT